MMDIILLAIVAGVFGIIGAVAGVVVAERMARQREERAEQKQVVAVRTLLTLEIDKNLALLREFWERASEPQEDEAALDPDSLHLRLASRLAYLPLPVWSNNAFESQLPIFPLALSEEEIRQVYDLRSGLENISDFYSKIATIERPQGGFRSTTPQMVVGQIEQESFKKKMSALWQGLEKSVNRILEKGNPLKG